MIRIIPLLPLALIAWNCSTSELVTPTGSEKSMSYRDLTSKLANENVRICFIDGQRTSGAGFRLEIDSSSWVDRKLGQVVKVPTSSIDRIETKNGFTGGLIGLGVGAGAGALIGYRIAAGNQPHGDTGNGWEMMGYTGGGGFLGGAIGIAIGSVIGTTKGYQIASDSTGHSK